MSLSNWLNISPLFSNGPSAPGVARAELLNDWLDGAPFAGSQVVAVEELELECRLPHESLVQMAVAAGMPAEVRPTVTDLLELDCRMPIESGRQPAPVVPTLVSVAAPRDGGSSSLVERLALHPAMPLEVAVPFARRRARIAPRRMVRDISVDLEREDEELLVLEGVL